MVLSRRSVHLTSDPRFEGTRYRLRYGTQANRVRMHAPTNALSNPRLAVLK